LYRYAEEAMDLREKLRKMMKRAMNSKTAGVGLCTLNQVDP
jgi:hypothetical protein